MPLRRILPLAALLLLSVQAEEEAEALKEGHSHQGDAFNEGPRQSAILMPGTGTVKFPVQSKWREAQAYFHQGIGQLHGFWYYEAERTFREISAHDPECAMAYWGMAMANWENKERAKGFIKEAVERKDQASARNRLYIEAQANFLDDEPKDEKKRCQELIKDLENIIHEHPEDDEARAFLACRLWQFTRKGIPISSPEAVDAMMQLVLSRTPNHPIHHFRIHVWDQPKAERALDSAAVLGKSAPAIAHMWHMPGHIYSKLERWDDSAFAQQASARIDHRYMIERRVMPDQIHNYAHNNEWLARNWMNMGRAHDALGMARSLIANPRHPDWNTLEKRGRSAAYGRQRLCEVLTRFEMWDEALRLSESAWLEPTGIPAEQVRRLRLIAAARFAKGNDAGLEDLQGEFEPLLAEAKARVEEAKEKAQAKAEEEQKKDEEINKLVKDAAKKPEGEIKDIEKAMNETQFYRDLLAGDLEAAKEKIKEVRRDKYDLARLHLRLGNEEEALKLSKEEVEKNGTTVLPHLARIEILHALGKRDETLAALEEFRPHSAWLDGNLPVTARLEGIAQDLGMDGWRGDVPVRDDIGKRPGLDSLGPIAWHPYEGTVFSLPNGEGSNIALADHKGKPVLLIFYLGHGCLHCVDQLKIFAEKFDSFREAGFEVLAVSTDSEKDLVTSRSAFAEGGRVFPIPMVANPGMEVFRAWNAYDDFEKQPLHGTFILDPAGRVLWQDIGADPFEDADFVLEEGLRLLELHQQKPEA